MKSKNKVHFKFLFYVLAILQYMYFLEKKKSFHALDSTWWLSPILYFCTSIQIT